MSVSGTPVTTYDVGFPKAHPSLPPSPRRSGRGGVQRRTRVASPRSDLERRGEGGRGGWGLGKPVVVRRDRRTGNRQAGGGPDSPIGFPKAHPPHPPGGSAAIGSPEFRTETPPERKRHKKGHSRTSLLPGSAGGRCRQGPVPPRPPAVGGVRDRAGGSAGGESGGAKTPQPQRG